MTFPIIQQRRNSIAGWFFSEEEIASAISSCQMLNPSIDLSNPCNLNCPYCYVEEKNSPGKLRRPNELSYEETIQVIHDLRSCGAKTINIVGAGEPTIDPHFEEVVNSIARLGMTTVLFTNGIRFCHQPELAEFLYDKGASVVLKYNSRSSHIQDLVAGRRGYTRDRNAALNILIAKGFTNSEPTRLGIDIIVFKGNVAEIPEIHEWCRSQNIFPLAGEFIPTGRTDAGEFQGFSSLGGFSKSEREEITTLLQPITYKQRFDLVNKLEAIDKSLGIMRPETFAYFGGGVCTQRLGLYVDIEGNIWPCVARRQKKGTETVDGFLGNIRQGVTPSQVWRRTPYLKNLRDNFSGGCPFKPPLDLMSTSSHEPIF